MKDSRGRLNASQTILADKRDRDPLMPRTLSSGPTGHRRSESGSSLNQLYEQTSGGIAGISSSGGSVDFARSGSYPDRSGGEADQRFKTQQRIRTLQLELAEKQVALLQEQDKRLEAEQRLLISIDHSKRAAAINQYVFKANNRLQQEVSEARNEVERLRKDKVELYAAFKAVLEKLDADLLASCAEAPSDVRSFFEAALQGPLELIRASGGMDDASSGPTPLSDALSVLKLAPGTPAETEESTDRIPSPSDSISVSSLRSNNTLPAAPPVEVPGAPGTPAATSQPLSGLTVEQIESLGDMADFQATDSLLQKMAEGVELLVGPHGLEGGVSSPRRPLPHTALMQTVDHAPTYSREIMPAASSPLPTRVTGHQRTPSGTAMTRSLSGPNFRPGATYQYSQRALPPASRSYSGYNGPGSRSSSVTPSRHPRPKDEHDEGFIGFSSPDIHRASSTGALSLVSAQHQPTPRRMLSPHQGIKKNVTPSKEPRTFGIAPSTPVRDASQAAAKKAGPESLKEVPSTREDVTPQDSSGNADKTPVQEETKTNGKGKKQKTDSQGPTVAGKLAKVAKKSWFTWSK